MAPRHMGQGSQLVYISQPVSWCVFKILQAWRMAFTSAWAVGSLVLVTLFAARAIIFPSFTTTAPKGPPLPDLTLFTESSIASCINFLSLMLALLITCINKYNQL